MIHNPPNDIRSGSHRAKDGRQCYLLGRVKVWRMLRENSVYRLGQGLEGASLPIPTATTTRSTINFPLPLTLSITLSSIEALWTQYITKGEGSIR